MRTTTGDEYGFCALCTQDQDNEEMLLSTARARRGKARTIIKSVFRSWDVLA